MSLALVLPLPAEVAARVALPASVPGALPASDLHVTVAVLTSAPPDLLGSLAALAAQAAPLAATLSGTGRFASPAAEGDAFYLSVDAPALVELRARIESEPASSAWAAEGPRSTLVGGRRVVLSSGGGRVRAAGQALPVGVLIPRGGHSEAQLIAYAREHHLTIASLYSEREPCASGCISAIQQENIPEVTWSVRWNATVGQAELRDASNLELRQKIRELFNGR